MKAKGRIAFLAVSLAAVAAVSLAAPRQPAERAAPGPLTVAVATDLHYVAPELTDGGAYFTRIVENGDGKAMAYCEEITDAFVEHIAGQSPDALLLSGDLTFNGARASHEALAKKLKTIEETGVPVLVIPGNHDLNSAMAASFRDDTYTLVESVDAESFAEIYASFGYDEALSRDDASLSYTYALAPGLWALMLDVNTADSPGALTDDTFQWARRQLTAAREAGVRVLAVSHQNLLSHNSLFSVGYVIKNGDRLIRLYEQYGVLCNVSGHMHIQHIAESGAGLPEIVTSSLITAPFRYGVLELDGAALEYGTEQLAFPHEAEAAQFFWDTSYRSAAEELDASDEALRCWFADVNAAYFAGRADQAEWDNARYREVQQKGVLLGVYLQSIRDDGFRDHTHLHIQLGG